MLAVGVVESCSAFDIRVLAVGVGVGIVYAGNGMDWMGAGWYATSRERGNVFFIHTFAELVVLRVVSGTFETNSKHTDTPKHMPRSGMYHLHLVKAFFVTLLICVYVFESIVLLLWAWSQYFA